MYFICLLNLNLLSIIIPKYLILSTCSRWLLFRYISITFLSLRHLDISMTFDFWSLKCNLSFFYHCVILPISMFVKFPTSPTVAAFTAINRSSAYAIALVHFAYLKFSNELYWIFQYPGPLQDPWVNLCLLLFLFSYCLFR